MRAQGKFNLLVVSEQDAGDACCYDDMWARSLLCCEPTPRSPVAILSARLRLIGAFTVYRRLTCEALKAAKEDDVFRKRERVEQNIKLRAQTERRPRLGRRDNKG